MINYSHRNHPTVLTRYTALLFFGSTKYEEIKNKILEWVEKPFTENLLGGIIQYLVLVFIIKSLRTLLLKKSPTSTASGTFFYIKLLPQLLILYFIFKFLLNSRENFLEAINLPNGGKEIAYEG
jgi:hypothetical protein